MLLAVSAAYGQQICFSGQSCNFSITINPPEPSAGQPVTFTVETIPMSQNWLFIFARLSNGTCGNYVSLDPYPFTLQYNLPEGAKVVALTANTIGQFTYALTSGLPGGTFCLKLVSAQAEGSPHEAYGVASFPNLTVSGATAVPEFNETFIVLSLSLATLCYILKGRLQRR
jgi:hypothetical protein